MDLTAVLRAAATADHRNLVLAPLLSALVQPGQRDGNASHAIPAELVGRAMSAALLAACRLPDFADSVKTIMSIGCGGISSFSVAASCKVDAENAVGSSAWLQRRTLRDALAIACESKNPSAVALLLERTSPQDATASLTSCVDSGCLESFKLLLRPKITDNSGGGGGRADFWCLEQDGQIFWDAARSSRWDFVLYLFSDYPPPTWVPGLSDVLICAGREGRADVLSALAQWAERQEASAPSDQSSENDRVGTVSFDAMRAAIKSARLCGHEATLMDSLSGSIVFGPLLRKAAENVAGQSWMNINVSKA
jgi:hypothetical protein